LKVCPRCFTRFPDGERFCLHDSAILVEEDDIARLGTSIGNYRLDKILGRGGMGTVYSGEHIYIKKPVAVKVLHPQFAKYQEAIHRFLREARAATAINHPNIVDVTDFGILPDTSPFLVMDVASGRSLLSWLEIGAIPWPWPFTVLWSFIDQILAGYDDKAALSDAYTIPAPWYVDPRIAELLLLLWDAPDREAGIAIVDGCWKGMFGRFAIIDGHSTRSETDTSLGNSTA